MASNNQKQFSIYNDNKYNNNSFEYLSNNVDNLMDLHDDIKSDSIYIGLMNNSFSYNFINVIINHLDFCNIHDVNEDDEINNENFEEDIILNQ